MTYAKPAGGRWTRDFDGTYARGGAGFDLKWRGAGHTSVRLDGTRLTMLNEGMSFVYEHGPGDDAGGAATGR